MTSGAEREPTPPVSANFVGLAGGRSASSIPRVAADAPAQQRQPLQERLRCEFGIPGSSRRSRHKHPDATHALRLLRRAPQAATPPPRRRAAYELPPPHSITSSARASSVGGDGEAEHPGGFRVDDQLELARSARRAIRRLSAFEDAADVDPLPRSRSTTSAPSIITRRLRQFTRLGRQGPHDARQASSCTRRLVKGSLPRKRGFRPPRTMAAKARMDFLASTGF